MDPKLIAIAGPLKGSVFVLTDAEISIGRESVNKIPIGDLSLSRRHCVITSESNQFWVRDLESLNGTFLNGMPVKERQLEHGDKITLGDSVFLFLLDETEIPAEKFRVRFDDGGAVESPVAKTVRLRPADAIYFDSAKVERPLPPDARAARDLNALLKINTTINTARSSDELQRRLLELIHSVVPVQTGAILMRDEYSDDIIATCTMNRGAGGGPVTISRTIAGQVINEGVSILKNDVLEDPDFESINSLLAAQTRSLLVAPLEAFDKVFGAIYLTTSDPIVWFDEDHLQLVTAIAGAAAVAMENLSRFEQLAAENKRLSEEINLSHNMVGESPRMRELYQRIARVAQTDSTVLIRGESGTGKELAARAIHQYSPRCEKPFLAINCATLTDTLLESELFGHEKGAFTGAIAQKKGKIELADGGTLFLDEIGELAPLLQAKLLRVLQEREFERVGGVRTIKTEIRIIAATNRNLEEEIKQNEKGAGFRADLYYRLNVVTLVTPPLRERREDIPLLASFFTAKYSERCKRQVRGISPAARARLINYNWPGNVRELENAIERAVVLGSDDLIQPEDLPEALLETEAPAEAAPGQYHEVIKQTKKDLILQAVEQAEGNYTEAAKLLGVHPNYLHRLIRNLNLKPSLKK